jgi:hypothetical protein
MAEQSTTPDLGELVLGFAAAPNDLEPMLKRSVFTRSDGPLDVLPGAITSTLTPAALAAR